MSQKLRCINSIGSSHLQRGHLYTAVAENEYGNIKVKDSNGQILENFYKPDRFVVFQEISLDKTYVTKDGRKVKIHAIIDDADAPVIGSIDEGAVFRQTCWTADGRHYYDECENLDLVECEQIIGFEGGNINESRQTIYFDRKSFTFEEFRHIVYKVWENIKFLA